MNSAICPLCAVSDQNVAEQRTQRCAKNGLMHRSKVGEIQHFSPEGLSVVNKTIENFIEKASRLYEQKRSAVSTAAPLEMYVRRWLRWARSGMASNAE
jgi:hypothetical protein